MDGVFWSSIRRRGQPKVQHTKHGRDALIAVDEFDSAPLPPLRRHERHIALAYFVGQFSPPDVALDQARRALPTDDERVQRAAAAAFVHEDDNVRQWGARLRRRHNGLRKEVRAEFQRLLDESGYDSMNALVLDSLRKWQDIAEREGLTTWEEVEEWQRRNPPPWDSPPT